MRKAGLLGMLIGLVLCVAIVPFVALAGDANQMSYVSVLNAGSTATTNAAVDISDYKGNAKIAVLWGTANGAGYTGTVTVTHSTTSTGTYSTVTNLAGTAGVLTNTGITTNEIDTYQIDLGRLSAWMKVAYTDNGEGTNSVAAVLVAPMKAD